MGHTRISHSLEQFDPFLRLRIDQLQQGLLEGGEDGFVGRDMQEGAQLVEHNHLEPEGGREGGREGRDREGGRDGGDRGEGRERGTAETGEEGREGNIKA